MAITVPGEAEEPAQPGVGDRRIEWAEREMPVLRAIRERFEAEEPLAGLRVAACLHVTAEAAVLVRTLAAGGADLVLVAADPLTTQDDVAASLAGTPKVVVHAARGEGEADHRRQVAAALGHRPHVIIDDDADLVGTLNSVALGRLDELPEEARAWAGGLSADERAGLAGDVAACLEGTAAGVGRLRALERAGGLEFPVIAVNDAQVKRLFDDRHGTGQSTIDGVLRATDMLMAGKRVVVCGYGWCGKGVARRAQGLGARVVVTEVDPIRALEAAMDGFEVAEIAQAARLGDLFITVTGNVGVIRGEHFAAMKDGATVCNSGHFGVELALDQLGELAASKNEAVRPSVDEYVMSDGRRIYVLGAGRLVNLVAAHGHPAAVMDMSFAVQVLAVEWALRMRGRLDHKVYNVPREVERWVAHLKLQGLGIAIDALTPEQAEHLEGRTVAT